MTTHPSVAAWLLHGRLLAGPLLVSLSACASFPGTVRESFSKTYTCPPDRIAVAPRPDIAGHAVVTVPDSPPADVANDPSRLALWRERRTKKEAEDDERQVFEARGCGHEERYACVVLGDETGTSVDCRDGSFVRAMTDAAAARQKLEEDARKIRAKLDERKSELSQSMAQLSLQQRELAALAAALEKHPHSHLGVSLGDGNGKGVVVLGVAPGGASDGRLATGDVITAVDGIAVAGMIDFVRAVVRHRTESPLALTVKRGEETHEVELGAAR